jgi:hypothetical protein
MQEEDKDVVSLMNSEAMATMDPPTSYNNSNNKPMTDDHDNPQQGGYSYKGAYPWTSPPAIESDATVFHAKQFDNVSPKVRHLVGSINIGVAINDAKRNGINIALLINHFMAFVKQTDTTFRSGPLNGSVQSISYPNHIPITKYGVEIYYQHRIVSDGI